MDKDLQRQIINVVTYLLTVIVNGLAVALPLNGLTTAEISDRFPVLVTPANYVFGIWSVIYLLLAVFTVYQALPGERHDPVLRDIGYPSGRRRRAQQYLGHLLALRTIRADGPRDARSTGHPDRDPSCACDPPACRAGSIRWAVALPFSVYLGWITVATIANISQMLYRAGYRGDPLGARRYGRLDRPGHGCRHRRDHAAARGSTGRTPW